MKIWRKCFLFCLGGGVYGALELLWRGRTHSSMFCLGGVCFLLLGKLAKLRLPAALLPLLGTLVVTAGELATGLLVNRDHSVWDYRALPYQFCGQICLQFSLLWMPLSLLAMALYRLVDRKLPA